MHQQHIVGDGQRVMGMMRRHHHGEAVVARQRGDALQHQRLILEIERRGRLVEHENIGLGDERARENDELALAAGERVERALGVSRHAEAIERRQRRRLVGARGLREQADVSRAAHHRHVERSIVEAHLEELRHEGDATFHLE